MSARTVYNPARFLSRDTLQAIKSTGVNTSEEYASNIENSLRIRGEHELAEQMLAEIDESLAEQK